MATDQNVRYSIVSTRETMQGRCTEVTICFSEIIELAVVFDRDTIHSIASMTPMNRIQIAAAREAELFIAENLQLIAQQSKEAIVTWG